MVSVIVPCRNEAGCVREFLVSVLGQDMASLSWEVIIADGMSDDGTRQIVGEYARQQANIRVIDNPERIVSTGLNRAIREAQGEIIVRMDVHTEYGPDYVRQCVAVLEETGADNVGGPANTRFDGWCARGIAAAYHARYGCGGARFHDPKYEGPVDTVPYGCWRKTTLERVGLFDETLVRNQDDELNLRIVRCGGRVWQSPRIRSWYKPRNSLRQLFRQYFQYGFWKIAVIRKHRLPASWRHLAPGAFVLGNLGLPLAWASAAAAGLNEVASFARWMWLLQLGGYGCATLLASLTTAARGNWACLPLLPLVFATYHVAYGLGFLTGMVYFAHWREPSGQPGRLFTEITR